MDVEARLKSLVRIARILDGIESIGVCLSDGVWRVGLASEWNREAKTLDAALSAMESFMADRASEYLKQKEELCTLIQDIPEEKKP